MSACSCSKCTVLIASVGAIVILTSSSDDKEQSTQAQPQTQAVAQHQHDHDHGHAHAQAEKQHQQPPSSVNDRGFPDLVTGLKNTDGCLGVETAQTESGKNCIFAWFENKQAVMNWYNSEMHQRAMNMFFPASEGEREPMKGVPDDIPIMAIASITMNDDTQQRQRDTTLPVSQIAIELYTPVTGGLHLGGTFAPDELDVPDLKDYGNLPK